MANLEHVWRATQNSRTHRRLVDVALRLFAEQGYDATATDQIARSIWSSPTRIRSATFPPEAVIEQARPIVTVRMVAAPTRTCRCRSSQARLIDALAPEDRCE